MGRQKILEQIAAGISRGQYVNYVLQLETRLLVL